MGHASSACPPEALLHYASLDWQAEVTSAPMGGTSSQYKNPDVTTDEREPTLAGTSWGDQLDAAVPLTDPEEDGAALLVFSTFANAESESEVESISLGSDDDEQDCEPYAIPSAAKPLVTGDTSHSGSPNLTATDLHDVCRRAAKKLGIEWLETTTTSRYRGNGFREPNLPADSCCRFFPSASRKQPGPGAILSPPRTPPWEGRRWTGLARRPAVFHICLL
ncbi:hypothetical protein GOODEAATRI_018722 [Goodea atripinnis]|uniref:Uncharacterized protein n=1 Tax=Goodea atripinnis TaxID=208336 RepID=A0ABV0MW98_9TELE